jgi:hypothetical protein
MFSEVLFTRCSISSKIVIGLLIYQGCLCTLPIAFDRCVYALHHLRTLSFAPVAQLPRKKLCCYCSFGPVHTSHRCGNTATARHLVEVAKCR